MNNSNIIVSIIIVLSIAAGVTVYGLNEGDNAVFSDLTGFTPASSDSGSNGLGDLISNDSNQQNSGMNGVSSPSRWKQLQRRKRFWFKFKWRIRIRRFWKFRRFTNSN